MPKCHGQTRMCGVRDEDGKSIICYHWLKLRREADEQRRLEFHRRGGMSAVLMLGMGR